MILSLKESKWYVCRWAADAVGEEIGRLRKTSEDESQT